MNGKKNAIYPSIWDTSFRAGCTIFPIKYRGTTSWSTYTWCCNFLIHTWN